jgi:signal transduction histidine kinase
MAILFAFAPFIAFALVDRLIGSTQGLVAGAAVSAILLLRDWFGLHRKPKILEVGTTILFSALALYSVLGGPAWSVMGVRLRVDIGLLLIVLITLAVGKPFTLQYAREQVPQLLWDTPEFIRSNYVITGVWSAAFLILVLADLLLIYRPDLPPRIGILATILALIGAFKFTQWYPEKDAPLKATS